MSKGISIKALKKASNVTPKDTTFFGIGRNLFDKGIAEEGKRINGHTGGTINAEDIYTSDYIKIEGGETYTRNYTDAYAIYDKEKKFISGDISTNEELQLEMESNAQYVRVSIKKEHLDDFQLEKGKEQSYYEPFNGKLKDDYINPIKNSFLPLKEDDTVFFEKEPKNKNLFNHKDENILRGKIIKDEGIVNLPAYMTTGYIKVGKHPIIVVSQKENTYDFVRAYTTYDENKNKIKTWADKYNYGTVLNLEPEAKYVRISTDNNAEQLQVEYGREPTDYVEYEEKKVLKEKYIPFETVGNDDNEILYVNEWYGKKATFNGDSITQGYLAGGTPYPNKVADKLGLRLVNHAIGGATLAADEGDDLLNFDDPDVLEGKIINSNGEIVEDKDYNLSGFIDISELDDKNHANIFIVSYKVDLNGIKSYATYDKDKNLVESHGDVSEQSQTSFPYIMVPDKKVVKYIRVAFPKEATDAEIRHTKRYPVVWRYQKTPLDSDLIVIAGGTNDWTSQKPLGSFEDRTPFTFYGALHIICEGLIEKFAVDKQVLFLTPIKRYEKGELRGGNSLEKFADAIIEVCAYYGIPVLDMFREATLNHDNPVHLEKLYGGDTGGHPNQAGHRLMARRLTGFLKQLN